MCLEHVGRRVEMLHGPALEVRISPFDVQQRGKDDRTVGLVGQKGACAVEVDFRPDELLFHGHCFSVVCMVPLSWCIHLGCLRPSYHYFMAVNLLKIRSARNKLREPNNSLLRAIALA